MAMNSRLAEIERDAFDRTPLSENARLQRVIEEQAKMIAQAAGVDPSRVIIAIGRR
jgi:hypothetical protein